MQQPNSQSVLLLKRAKSGFAFSLSSAILILLRGIVRIVRGDLTAFAGLDEIRRRFLAGLALNIVGGIAVAFAILIMVGTFLIYSRMEVAGGVFVIIFSLLSLSVGSGWLIGLIPGLVGGILALAKK